MEILIRIEQLDNGDIMLQGEYGKAVVLSSCGVNSDIHELVSEVVSQKQQDDYESRFDSVDMNRDFILPTPSIREGCNTCYNKDLCGIYITGERREKKDCKLYEKNI